MPWDQIWEEIFRSQDWGKYPAEDLIRFVARNFYRAPVRRSVALLEIGCGPGGNLWFMAREGFSVYGIDGSPTAIESARERLDREVPGWSGEMRVGDIVALDYPDAKFDAVIDSEAVYCNSFEDSVRIYGEARRVLKPGGKLFTRTFASGSVGDGTGARLGRDYWQVTDGPGAGKGPSRFTRREDVAELLRGYEIESMDLLTRAADGDDRRAVKEWLITAHKR